MRIYKLFAGAKHGKGAKDKMGFSINGQFYNFFAENEKDAIRQFRKQYKNFVIYDILIGRV